MDDEEHWYGKLASRYGEDFCRIAGYFDEIFPFTVPYGSVFDLPKHSNVVQFSGVFYPFHEGHLEIVKSVITNQAQKFVIHVDHAEYRTRKGEFSEEEFIRSFDMLNSLGIDWMLVEEDKMPNGCSRNFTRLYQELDALNITTTFLCGGDRANFALTFIDEGRCIVSGREDSKMYQKYSYLNGNGSSARIRFINGNNPASSTAIRNTLGGKNYHNM